MFLSKWTRYGISAFLAVFTVLVLLLLNVVLGLALMPFSAYASPSDLDLSWFANALFLFPLVFFPLASLYLTRDLLFGKGKIFASSKSTLISGAAAFLSLAPAALLFVASSLRDGYPLTLSPSSLIPIVAPMGLAFLSLVVGKILLNEYFGLKWHEHATPHVLKKIRGRR
ncbi:hypothetical protein COT29_02640 [Candidatus Micrarchaeota archaeon CG08_land_8_20_14_0_20_59_11]|nr:MAG: hypothetical protein COT29_02640 [Candidatus Micrarchaeota archaeon CG08_land_8_20_14_0_20_59_11]